MRADQYSRIFIIYNPNSTSGTAESRAKKLQQRLAKSGLSRIRLVATEYAGHAEEIAYDATCRYKHPLIVSVSGDGGYNEVINGALRASMEDGKRKPVCAIMAAGNANDHRRSIRRQPLSRAILRGAPEAIDILRLDANIGQKSIVRFAHSYIGFGMTSVAAKRLNSQQLTRWKELKIVVRTLLRFRFFSIRFDDGKQIKLDSLVFANIHRMSKVIRLGKKTDLHNGMFLVATVPHLPLPQRFLRVISIALFGYKETYRKEPYEFTIPYSQIAHFDGEVMTLPGGARVRVQTAQETLLTLR